MRRRPSAVLGALGVLVASGLAGCGATRAAITTNSVIACYRALPRAKDAVHDKRAAFKGVHEVSADQIEKRFPGVHVAENDTNVCVFAFQGSFAPGQVEGAPPSESGSYAVVVVTARHLRLLNSSVSSHLPERFTRRLP